MEKIADTRIVAVTQDGFAFEVAYIMPQLLLDVRELRVKLILLRRFGGPQTLI